MLMLLKLLEYLEQDENEFKQELKQSFTPKVMPEIIPEPEIELAPTPSFHPYYIKTPSPY